MSEEANYIRNAAEALDAIMRRPFRKPDLKTKSRKHTDNVDDIDRSVAEISSGNISR